MPGLEGAVSSSVFAIIAALNECRIILRNTRLTRHRRWSKTTKRGKEGECRLERSLTLGPSVIEEEYAQGMNVYGQRFADGDAEARVHLNKTLFELNAGLVKIIAIFPEARSLNEVKVDYNSLTTLSDRSRTNTQEGLAALRRRLAHFVTETHSRLPSTRNLVQGDDHDQATTKPKRKKNKKLPANKGTSSTPRNSTYKARKKRVEVSIAPYQSPGTARYALVRSRPRPCNLGSSPRCSSPPSSKASLSKLSKASPTFTATNTHSTAPSTSPNLRQSTHIVYPACNHEMLGTTPATSLGAFQQPIAKENLAQSPPSLNIKPLKSHPLPTRPPAQVPSKPKLAQNDAIPSVVQSTAIHNYVTDATTKALDRDINTTTRVQPTTTLIPVDRRRYSPQRIVESIYSFQSDSTKIGEIPLHKYSVPLDFSEMKRLNVLAGTAGLGLSHQGENLGHALETMTVHNSYKNSGASGLWARIIRKKRGQPILS